MYVFGDGSDVPDIVSKLSFSVGVVTLRLRSAVYEGNAIPTNEYQ
jgi:hypothetical protein